MASAASLTVASLDASQAAVTVRNGDLHTQPLDQEHRATASASAAELGTQRLH